MAQSNKWYRLWRRFDSWRRAYYFLKDTRKYNDIYFVKPIFYRIFVKEINRSVRLVGQDTTLSRWVHGFKSRTEYKKSFGEIFGPSENSSYLCKRKYEPPMQKHCVVYIAKDTNLDIEMEIIETFESRYEAENYASSIEEDGTLTEYAVHLLRENNMFEVQFENIRVSWCYFLKKIWKFRKFFLPL